MLHEQREAVQQEETLSSEVAAFCSLIAGIELRCLRQHGTRLERPLFLPAQSVEHQRGGTYDSRTAPGTSSHGRYRGEAAQGSVRPHARLLRGECR